MPELKLLRLDHGRDLPLPTYETPGSACMDIRSAERKRLWGGDTHTFGTGFAVEVPEGYELQVRSRSGLAAKHGVFVTNGNGTIDADYRGEIKVILTNAGRGQLEINVGDRIAQLALVAVERFEVAEVSALSDTLRGAGGLGSTGR